jgi:hypothetical protein
VFCVLDTGSARFGVVSCAISLFCTWKDEVDGFCSIYAITLSLCCQFLFSLFSLCYQIVLSVCQFVLSVCAISLSVSAISLYMEGCFLFMWSMM